MAFVYIGVAIHGSLIRIVKKLFHFRQKTWLIGFHGQEIIRSVVDNGLGDAGVASMSERLSLTINVRHE